MENRARISVDQARSFARDFLVECWIGIEIVCSSLCGVLSRATVLCSGL